MPHCYLKNPIVGATLDKINIMLFTKTQLVSTHKLCHPMKEEGISQSMTLDDIGVLRHTQNG